MMMMVELQLSLAPPNTTNITYEPKVVAASRKSNRTVLQLGPSCHPWLSSGSTKKRNHEDAAVDEYQMVDDQTLPLLLCDHNQPNEEDDDSEDVQKNCSFALTTKNDEESILVGWPPIKFPRKKLCHRRVGNGCADCEGRPSNSTYVKVKMEGVAIARKIDLSRYHSFLTLQPTLLAMFGISQENASWYKLTYQDTEGDWLLAEDVPWRRFIRNVQRLKLMRSSS